MPTATCKFKPDSKAYDYLFSLEEMDLQAGDLCVVESDYAAWGLIVVQVESIADNDVARASKRIIQKIENYPR